MPNEPEHKRTSMAAREIHDFLVTGLRNEQGTHIGTLLSSTARLAGTSLFRSFNINTKDASPGTPILSNEANEGWPKLTNLLMQVLKENGITIDPMKFKDNTKPPSGEEPRLDILQVQSKFQEGYNQIARKYGLNYEKGAFAGALACGTIIFRIAHAFDPNNLCAFASYSFVEGAKTVPVPLNPPSSSKPNTKTGFLDKLFGK